MNTKQIAEEAVDKINHQLDLAMDAIERASAIDEVQAAIEKRDWQWHDACCGVGVVPCDPRAVKKWIAEESELSCAAHASEPIIPDEIIDAANKVAHWAKINGWESGWCIGPVCDRAARGWRATR